MKQRWCEAECSGVATSSDVVRQITASTLGHAGAVPGLELRGQEGLLAMRGMQPAYPSLVASQADTSNQETAVV